jgi:hypothetical protein
MKRMTVGLIMAALVVGLAAGNAAAQDDTNGQDRRQKRQAKRRQQRKQRAQQRLERIAKAAELTDEQQTQLETAMKSFAQDAKNWRAENADRIQALRKEFLAAARDGDKDKLEELRKKRRELMAGLKAKAETHHGQIVKILGEEKGEKVVAMLKAAHRRRAEQRRNRRNPIARVVRALGDSLTDGQKEILKETAQAVKNAETREAKIKAAREGKERLQATLTDEQKQTIAAARKRRGNRGEPFSRLKKALGDSLTDEQAKLIEDTIEAVKDAEDRSGKRKAIREGMKEFRESLTDEQKQTLRKAIGRARGRRSGGRGGRQGRRSAAEDSAE